MTSSDLTRLTPGVVDAVAQQVGRSLDAGSLRDATSGRAVRVGIACAEFNGGISSRLLDGALAGLRRAGCDLAAVTVAWVPGAFELPLVASALIRTGSVDAVICLGAVIRGDTGHYEFVAGECAAGLQRVQLDTGVPVVFGVLTTDTVDQALERSEDDDTNKGFEAASTAIGMRRLLDALSSGEA